MPSSFDQPVDRHHTNRLKWTRYAKDVLPLWVADMDFPAPEPARHALQTALNHGVFGYELPTKKLAQTVPARMERLYTGVAAPQSVRGPVARGGCDGR
jgi:cystathionine beta-lyase